ncbi:MAG: glycerate kinase [Herbinix sp.]|jgi:glycerate kinase|nr:glycerate kinase [Herbinix sp.]
MKKCIIMPDSFKGTLTAMEFCDITEKKILEFYPDCIIHKIPVADGGEGTVDCFLGILEAEKVFVTIRNAYMENITAYYARKGRCAIIEMAQAAGLPQVEGRMNPSRTTTYGFGELIKHAVTNGCNEIILGLGGSCTNDGGTGMASALGTVFLDKDGNNFLPVGGSLNRIIEIDNTQTISLLSGVTIRAMCDISNPLHGQKGAAYIFAPQKGADEAMVKHLDEQLQYLDHIIFKELGIAVSALEGAGAAGGLGAGVVAFLGGTLNSGIETVLDLVNYDELIDNADCIITGEGRIDQQSMEGKVVIGLARRATIKGVPVIAVVGSIGEGAEEAYQRGVTSIFSINRQAEDFSISRYKTHDNLRMTLDSIMRLYGMANR